METLQYETTETTNEFNAMNRVETSQEPQTLDSLLWVAMEWEDEDYSQLS